MRDSVGWMFGIRLNIRQASIALKFFPECCENHAIVTAEPGRQRTCLPLLRLHRTKKIWKAIDRKKVLVDLMTAAFHGKRGKRLRAEPDMSI